MIQKILTTVCSIMLLLSVSGQCFYEKIVNGASIAYTSRRTKIYDSKRTAVYEVYMYFEKHFNTKSQPPFSRNAIVLRVHGLLDAEAYSVLQLTFDDETVLSLYLPTEYDKRSTDSYLTYETSGIFGSNGHEMQVLGSNRVKSARLINEDDQYIKVKISPTYFIDAINCVRDLN